MNLAWLASVLQPNDVAPHPNFRTEEYDRQKVPRLAAAILGDGWRVSDFDSGEKEQAPDDWLGLVESSLRSETIASGVTALSSRLREDAPEDAAHAVALTLAACAAAAELDDYETCFTLLDLQLQRLAQDGSPAATVLLRAALLQQKALRLCDTDQDHVPVAIAAGSSLLNLDLTACDPFTTSPAVAWTSDRTLEQIRLSLIEAAAGLVPSHAEEMAANAGLPSRFDVIREPPTDVDFRLASARAENYARNIDQEFKVRYGGATTTWVSGPPDLYRSLLRAELLGDGRVYALRRDLAILRFVRSEADPAMASDALRLFRQAGAKNELDLALRKLRFGGPLSPLAVDARQILRMRMGRALLRVVELKVLTVAADLLAPSEARLALNAIRLALDSGAPPDLPMQWQLEVLRREAAWIAVASLGRVCGASTEAAEIILQQASNGPLDDQLTDASLRRAVSEMHWADVSPGVREAWRAFLRGGGERLDGTKEAVFLALGEAVPNSDRDSPLDASIKALNAVLAGLSESQVDRDRLRAGISSVRAALSGIREQAAKGMWSGGECSQPTSLQGSS